MHRVFRGVLLGSLIGLLAACGRPATDADQMASEQQALAATVAAAPASAAGASGLRPVVTPTAAPTSAPTASATATTESPVTAASTSAPLDPTATTQPTPTALATDAAARQTAPTIATTATAKATAAALPATTASSAANTPAPTTTIAASATPVPPTAIPATATSVPTAAPPAVADVPPDNGQPVELLFSELYSGASITGPTLSPKAQALNGRRVVMQGFMAPPLKPDLDFFVLTKTPMVYCPFCSSATDWPFDIVFVRMAGGKTAPPITPTKGIRVTGRFEVGVATDPATGFVSMIRIIADDVQVTN